MTSSTRTSGDLDDLAMALIYLDLCNITGTITGIGLDELSEIDALTPFYREKLNNLSVQKRKILTAIVREGIPLRIREIAEPSGIVQHGIVSMQVNRLVKDGLVQRLDDGRYTLSNNDPGLVKYLYARLTEFKYVWTSARSEELIPDRNRPISYFIMHRKEIADERQAR